MRLGRYAGSVAVAVALALAGAGALGLAACATGPTSSSPRTGDGAGGAVVATDGSTTGDCQAPPIAPAKAARSEALTALLEGRAGDALTLLDPIVRRQPNDIMATALHVAAKSSVDRSSKSLGDSLSNINPVRLESVSAPGPMSPAATAVSSAPFQLKIASSKANLITDDDAWLKDHGLVRPAVFIGARDTTIPSYVASALAGDGPLRRLMVYPDHTIGLYGGAIGVFSPGKTPRIYSLASVLDLAHTSIDRIAAQLVGDTLIVAGAFNGYTKEVRGKTGYVAAFDASTGRALWVSEPLVASAQNFLVSGGFVVTGIGFSGEPDFIHVLDLSNGKTVQRISVPSAPEMIIAKNDQVFVRTYDHDMVFSVQPKLEPAAGAKLGAATTKKRTPTEERARCRMEQALVAADARDIPKLRAEIVAAHEANADASVLGAFAGTLKFLEQRQTMGGADRTIDLTEMALVVAEPPPWDARPAAQNGPRAKAPRLVKQSEGPSNPVRPLPGRGTFQVDVPFSIPPVDQGKLPPNARPDIPTAYALEPLRLIAPSGDKTILVYGGRHVVVLAGSTMVGALDLSAYLLPPNPGRQWAEFAVEDATHALEEGGTLYVCNGGGSYARDVGGKKGFVSAISLSSGKLLWRSPPLVCNSNLAMWNDVLISGYGFTDEPDFVTILSKATGELLSKTSVASGPESVRVVGNALRVETYDRSYDFAITN